MPDNFISYGRFAALPANIAEFGQTLEELNLQRGRPERNVALQPLAAPLRSRRLLALSHEGSDDLRIAEPVEPGQDAYEGPQQTLVLSRLCAKKLSQGVLGDLQAVVEKSEPSEQQALMQDSLQRVLSMRDALNERNAMSESIYVRALAASRS